MPLDLMSLLNDLRMRLWLHRRFGSPLLTLGVMSSPVNHLLFPYRVAVGALLFCHSFIRRALRCAIEQSVTFFQQSAKFFQKVLNFHCVSTSRLVRLVGTSLRKSSELSSVSSFHKVGLIVALWVHVGLLEAQANVDPSEKSGRVVLRYLKVLAQLLRGDCVLCLCVREKISQPLRPVALV